MTQHDQQPPAPSPEYVDPQVELFLLLVAFLYAVISS